MPVPRQRELTLRIDEEDYEFLVLASQYISHRTSQYATPLDTAELLLLRGLRTVAQTMQEEMEEKRREQEAQSEGAGPGHEAGRPEPVGEVGSQEA